MCRISIITALHNKGPYIAETINSVRCQTLAEWEMIVVENGSTDNGPDVVASLAAQDNRIQLIRGTKEVCGPCAARNLGIEQVKGEWLLFLDADDLIEPEHLQDMVNASLASGADVVAGGWREFIEGTDACPVLRDGPAPGATAATVLESCLASAPWAVHAALIRCEWLGAVYRWPMEMERLPSEDSVFWFRLLHGAKLATVPTHSAVYRKETPGNRDAHRDLTLWVEAILRVIRLNEEFLQNHGLRPTRTQAAHVMRSLEALWIRSRNAGAESETATVQREAKRWLKMTGMEAGPLLRRIIGIRGFNALRRGIRKC
jgi:glycosyltransferase involved in cell wall biosynthesis